MSDFDNNSGKMIVKAFINDEAYGKYEKFLEEYGEKSDQDLYKEIENVQSEVSNDIKKQHLNNLELLGKMNGFISDEIIKRINYTKKIIIIEEENNSLSNNVEGQFFGGASLLLWFLLVTVIFRKGKRRRRRRRGFNRY